MWWALGVSWCVMALGTWAFIQLAQYHNRLCARVKDLEESADLQAENLEALGRNVRDARQRGFMEMTGVRL